MTILILPFYRNYAIVIRVATFIHLRIFQSQQESVAGLLPH